MERFKERRFIVHLPWKTDVSHKVSNSGELGPELLKNGHFNHFFCYHLMAFKQRQSMASIEFTS